MKKFKVFLRVVGTVSMDAEADGPEEAAEKVCDSIHDEGATMDDYRRRTLQSMRQR